MRRLFIVSACFLTFSPAFAKSLGYSEIRAICTGVEKDNPTVDQKYKAFLNKNYAISPVDTFKHENLSELFKHCRFADSTEEPYCGVAQDLFSELVGLLGDGSVGPKRLSLKTPKQQGKDIDIAGFLQRDTKIITCSETFSKKEKKTKSPGLNLNWNTFSITKDSSTATKAISKKESAELTINLNRGDKQKIANPDDSITFKNKDFSTANFNLALRDFIKLERSKPSDKKAPGPSITPFLALDYKSNLDPKEETDDFSVGVIWKQYISDRNFKSGSDPFDINEEPSNLGDLRLELDHFLLEGSYITDIEQRESQQWATQLTVPFASLDASSFSTKNAYFTSYISADIILDHMKIARPGDKKALIKLIEEQNVSKLTRLGYEIRLNSIFALDEAWALGFDAKYQYRDAFQNGGLGDVDRWVLGWDFKPSVDANLSFGVTYERGEAVKSLKEEELWTFGIKYKQ